MYAGLRPAQDSAAEHGKNGLDGVSSVDVVDVRVLWWAGGHRGGPEGVVHVGVLGRRGTGGDVYRNFLARGDALSQPGVPLVPFGSVAGDAVRA